MFAMSIDAVAAYPVRPLPLVPMRCREEMKSSAFLVLPLWDSTPLRSSMVYCVGVSAVTLVASPSFVSLYWSSKVSSVSKALTSRAWSGLVMMFCPSKMSLAPPPVTPRRKLPPRFGLPAAEEAPLPLCDDGFVPEQAESPATAAAPAAPTNSCRRETPEVSGEPSFSRLSDAVIAHPQVVVTGVAAPAHGPPEMLPGIHIARRTLTYHHGGVNHFSCGFTAM